MVEPLPWWAYAVMAASTAFVGGVVWALRLFFRHYVIDTVPKDTVALIITAKDAEIGRARSDSDNWRAAFHVKDAAYEQLAQSLDELTDALEAGNQSRGNGRSEAPNDRRRSSRQG